MIEKLKKINDKYIELNKDNEVNLKKHVLIKQILNDSRCFFKMDIENAYAILRDLGIKEENLQEIYKELIDIKNFN